MAGFYGMPSFDDFFGPFPHERHPVYDFRMRCGPGRRGCRMPCEDPEFQTWRGEPNGLALHRGQPPPPPAERDFPHGPPPPHEPHGPPPPHEPHSAPHHHGPPGPPGFHRRHFGEHGRGEGPPGFHRRHFGEHGRGEGPPGFPHRHFGEHGRGGPRRPRGDHCHRSSLPGFGHVQLNRDGAAARLVVLLPGVPRDQLKLEVLQKTLTVEVAGASFSRSFTLGDTIDVDAIDAALDLGLLTITLPYKEKAEPRRVPIGGATASAEGEGAVKPAPAEARASSSRDEEGEADAVQEIPQASKGEWVDVHEEGEEDSPHGEASSDEDGSIEDCPYEEQA